MNILILWNGELIDLEGAERSDDLCNLLWPWEQTKMGKPGKNL